MYTENTSVNAIHRVTSGDMGCVSGMGFRIRVVPALFFARREEQNQGHHRTRRNWGRLSISPQDKGGGGAAAAAAI